MLLDTQESKVFYKKELDFWKLIVVMLPHIVEKVAVFGLGLLWKQYSLKVPKTAICQHSLADSGAQTSHAT